MERKRMDIAEFRSLGLLQEVNRRVLHPLGLALEVTKNDDGTERLSGVWDARDDREGIVFSPVDDDLRAKAANVDAMWAERETDRVAGLGYMVQPVEASD